MIKNMQIIKQNAGYIIAYEKDRFHLNHIAYTIEDVLKFIKENLA